MRDTLASLRSEIAWRKTDMTETLYSITMADWGQDAPRVSATLQEIAGCAREGAPVIVHGLWNGTGQA